MTLIMVNRYNTGNTCPDLFYIDTDGGHEVVLNLNLLIKDVFVVIGMVRERERPHACAIYVFIKLLFDYYLVIYFYFSCATPTC